MAVKPKAIPAADEAGDLLILSEVDFDTYVPITPAAESVSWNPGSLSSSEDVQEANKTERRAQNQKVRRTSHQLTNRTTGILMQEDVDLLNLFSDTVKGKRFVEIYYLGYYNAKYNYCVKLGEVTPQRRIARPIGDAGSMPYEFTATNDISVTLSATFFASLNTVLTISTNYGINFITVSVTVSARKQYALVEVS